MTTIKDLADLKKRGQKWAMLTSYEMMTAEIFDEAGIPVLLVGDSAGNNFFGDANTIPVTVEELLPLVRAVSRSVKQSLVVADLPFGSYESGPEQALATSIRFFKESGAHAVKLEGATTTTLESVKRLVGSGIPVMGHLGLTPQSVHQLGGFKVQGRENPEALIEAAKALEAAGVFALVIEMVPKELAKLSEPFCSSLLEVLFPAALFERFNNFADRFFLLISSQRGSGIDFNDIFAGADRFGMLIQFRASGPANNRQDIAFLCQPGFHNSIDFNAFGQ